MIEITPERLLTFREKLKKEMFGDQSWYHPTKEHNRDIIVIHPECPYADKKGRVPEHRYIWWVNNKSDKIAYNECIHHKNGNHQDNRIENLEKLKLKQHGQAHSKLRQQKLNKGI